MEQTLELMSKKLNGKLAIIALTSLAILARGLGFIETIIGQIAIWSYDETHFVSMIWPIIRMGIFALIDVLPFILLLVYLFVFYSKSKATILLPISLGAFALGQLFHLVSTIVNLFQMVFQALSITGWSIENILTYAFSYGLSYFLVSIPYAIGIILAAVAAVGTLKGLATKPLAVVPSVLLVVLQAASAVLMGILQIITMIVPFIVGSVHMPTEQLVYSLFVLLAGLSVNLSVMLFFTGVAIFAAKNYIPEIIPMKEEKLSVLAAKKPKAALEILRNRFESGKLTEEEYSDRVAAIDNH